MKYALLIYSKPGTHEELSASEGAAVTGEYMALTQEAGYLDGAQLQPVETATTLRQGDGETLVTDGPFADTKEVFGGYYVFEADNLDRATELASRLPTIRLGGSVEIRPVVEY
jgi:hypothetical protein